MSEDLTLAEISTDVVSSLNTNFSQVEDAVNAKAQKNGDSTKVFNVADAVELTEAVNKRQLDTIISTINSKLSSVEARVDGMLIDGYRFPDLENGVSMAWATTHTAECDGWLNVYICSTTSTTGFLYVNDIPVHAISVAGALSGTYNMIPISKGNTYLGTGGSGCGLTFYPAKGAN